MSGQNGYVSIYVNSKYGIHMGNHMGNFFEEINMGNFCGEMAMDFVLQFFLLVCGSL